MIVMGVVVAFVLLIAAVWASDVGLATSLGVTGGLVLVGVITVAMVIPDRRGTERVDDQRDRMRQTTP